MPSEIFGLSPSPVSMHGAADYNRVCDWVLASTGVAAVEFHPEFHPDPTAPAAA